MITKLVNSAITEEQFEECPLTLKELYIIMDVFTTTMTNMYHQRIEYPKMPTKNERGSTGDHLRDAEPSFDSTESR